MTELNKYIKEVLSFVEVEKSEQLVITMEKYIKMLFSWHELHNIIGTKDPIYFIKRDIHDSLAMSKYLPDGKLLDVGTGGGIPGVIIAMIKKESQLLLMDRKDKPIRFLEQVKLKLNINNITVIKQNLEAFKEKSGLTAIVLKNFSNKNVSKMTYRDKILYIIKTVRENLGENLPVYFLTGSKALELQNFSRGTSKKGQNNFFVTEIHTPFFENKRYLLESCT